MTDTGKQYEHLPVLLEEVLEMWFSRGDGFYVDGTFGRGGHSRALLAKLDADGRLTGIDRDPLAIAEGEKLAGQLGGPFDGFGDRVEVAALAFLR